MKVVIAGSRSITNYNALIKAIEYSVFNGRITEVVSGTATGADQLGETWAVQNEIPIKKFPAEWNKHGRAAGPIRNTHMANYADGAIVLWDGKSPGSLNMIRNIQKLNKPFFINVVEQ